VPRPKTARQSVLYFLTWSIQACGHGRRRGHFGLRLILDPATESVPESLGPGESHELRRHQENHAKQNGPIHCGVQKQSHQNSHWPSQSGILDTIQVDYYGSTVPLSQVANVSLIDSRTISVQPWEKNMAAKIEKAIRESDLGLNPASMGDLIRVPMPPMSEERRREMTKLVRTEGENAKIAVRNLRRDANESVKKLVKEKLASEDEQKRSEAEVQKVTDKHIAEIDQLIAGKEQEIMAV